MPCLSKQCKFWRYSNFCIIKGAFPWSFIVLGFSRILIYCLESLKSPPAISNFWSSIAARSKHFCGAIDLISTSQFLPCPWNGAKLKVTYSRVSQNLDLDLIPWKKKPEDDVAQLVWANLDLLIIGTGFYSSHILSSVSKIKISAWGVSLWVFPPLSMM